MKKIAKAASIGAALVIILGAIDIDPGFARGGRGGGGGGMRGGGGGGMRAGGGARGGGIRSGASTSISRPSASRNFGSSRGSVGRSSGIGAGQLPAGGRGGGLANSGGVAGGRGGGLANSGTGKFAQAGPQGGRGLSDAGNRPSQLPNRGDGNFSGNGNRINTGDRNTNINVDNGWGNGWGGWVDHPVGAGFVAGAVVGAASAAAYGYGAHYYDLPVGCSPYYTSYYSCGGVYYEPRYEGDTVVYVTVPDPSTGAVTTTAPDPFAVTP